MIRFFKKKNLSELEEVFNNLYYKRNDWRVKETGSGPGSTLSSTKRIREEIPILLKSLGSKSLLDAPCGDFNWMSQVTLDNIQYTGADIIKKLIKENIKKFPEKKFIVADLTKDPLPYADIILCRDCFIHLPNHLIIAAIKNFKLAGIRHMLTNTYNFIEDNADIKPGQFRMINLTLPPFSLPAPDHVIEEEYTSGYPDKQLALWKL